MFVIFLSACFGVTSASAILNDVPKPFLTGPGPLDNNVPVGYRKTVGACRGVEEHYPSSQNPWKCVTDGSGQYRLLLDVEDCAAACRSELTCGAFDRPDGDEKAECCLSLAGTQGNGWAGHSCYVEHLAELVPPAPPAPVLVDEAVPYGYGPTVGACRGGGENYPGHSTLWSCLDDEHGNRRVQMAADQCAALCDADDSCGAFDRPSGPALGECCLFQSGNAGDGGGQQGSEKRTCWVGDLFNKGPMATDLAKISDVDKWGAVKSFATRGEPRSVGGCRGNVENYPGETNPWKCIIDGAGGKRVIYLLVRVVRQFFAAGGGLLSVWISC